MSRLLFPDASLRSPTAVQDRSDLRDENIYSAMVVSHGATGQKKVFTVPQGQAIPILGNGVPAAHQQAYTELTTNISQPGQLGSALGEASIRRIGITIEQAYYNASGALNSYGAGQQEVAEICSKTFFQFRIGGKLQIQGPTLFFPASGSVFGSISTNATNATVAALNNGWPGQLRPLKLPILVARTDTVEGTFGVAGGASLAFSVTTSPFQPTLVWFNLHALVKGDAR
jgi:hypothetical protein